MKIRKINRDRYGIIGQKRDSGRIPVEGGDSACWQGHYTYYKNDDGVDYIKTFKVGFGAYVRHPDPKKTDNGFGAFYKNPWTGVISRDQLTGILGGVIRQGNAFHMLEIILHSLCSLMLFTYNSIDNGKDPKKAPRKFPDPMFFNMWGMMIRGLGFFTYILWPLLWILDLQLVLDSLVSNRHADDDQINFLLRLSVSRDIAPTPISWLAVKLLDRDKLKKDLKSYWVDSFRDQPGMLDVHCEAIDRL